MLRPRKARNKRRLEGVCYNLKGTSLKSLCSRNDKYNGYLIISTLKCQFFRLLWRSWMMQEADVMNAEQFPATDTFREFMPPPPRTKGLLGSVIICSGREFTVWLATPFTLLNKALILIYWLWLFKNSCILGNSLAVSGLAGSLSSTSHTLVIFQVLSSRGLGHGYSNHMSFCLAAQHTNTHVHV